jgi:ABC-type transport system involved in multi-copper enzyme maturation permease subunit
MSLTDVKPDFLVNFAGDSVSYMMNDPYPVDSKTSFGTDGQSMTIWNYYPEPLIAVGVMIVYAVVTFALGYIAFRKREMVT